MPSKGFSTNKRARTFWIAGGGLALLAAIVYVWPLDPADYAPVPRRAQPDGETVGWVSKVESSTIYVNSGPFGGGIVPLLVTRNTRVTVGSKEGWFEDIRPGGQVKVTYDVFEGRRMARTVELLVDEGARRVTGSQPRPRGPSGAAVTERAPATTRSAAEERPAIVDKPVEPAAGTAAPSKPPAAAPTEKPNGSSPAREVRALAKPEPARTPAAEPERSRTPATAARGGGSTHETARPLDPSPPSAATIPTTLRSPEPRRGPEGGGIADGSEAVDWLLKQRN
ncbi:MAG TPA: hypothetical protein VIG37_07445 [Methylomirabilota bacterium]|jgi:hypothetical protein